MAVKFNGHNYRDQHEVYVRVEGADPIARKTGKRLMAAQHVQMRFLREDGEDWEVQWVTVSGGLVKADGQPGAEVKAERFHRHSHHEWPEWLKTLVEESTPETLASVARDPLGSVE